MTDRRRQRVAHLTSVHPVGDTRILHRECAALASAGLDVTLVACGEPVSEIPPGVTLDLVSPSRGRLRRVLFGSSRVGWRAYRGGAGLVHLHDPELIWVGILLKLAGRKVVFDSHEDLRRDVLDKDWVPRPLRRTVGSILCFFARVAGKTFDLIVVASPEFAEPFGTGETILVRNYENADRFPSTRALASPARILYVGSVTKSRGALEMAAAAATFASPDTGSVFVVVGEVSPTLREEMDRVAGDARVEYLGRVSRDGVTEQINRASVGLSLLHPTPQYKIAIPTKIIEYAAGGVPSLVSNFGWARRTIDKLECGVTVDPLDPVAIARAVQEMLDDPAAANEMGARGRQAVIDHMNWDQEADKLLAAYRAVLT